MMFALNVRPTVDVCYQKLAFIIRSAFPLFSPAATEALKIHVYSLKAAFHFVLHIYFSSLCQVCPNS